MPQGITIWDASGNVVIDVTTRITRLIASVTLAYNDFSVHTFDDDGFLTGTPFWLVDNQNNAYGTIVAKSALLTYVNISVSGTTCTFQQGYTTGGSSSNVKPSPPASNTMPLKIYFGVY
jgi:hypothetical protein